ncbi:hypothetical protein, partial [Pectobacterium parmentieri]|uniref:hypothetical protein n=1 Tax=Pectobacterium parmentieri TaxID=1905730 RepID=UPI001E3A8B95
LITCRKRVSRHLPVSIRDAPQSSLSVLDVDKAEHDVKSALCTTEVKEPQPRAKTAQPAA